LTVNVTLQWLRGGEYVSVQVSLYGRMIAALALEQPIMSRIAVTITCLRRALIRQAKEGSVGRSPAGSSVAAGLQTPHGSGIARLPQPPRSFDLAGFVLGGRPHHRKSPDLRPQGALQAGDISRCSGSVVALSTVGNGVPCQSYPSYLAVMDSCVAGGSHIYPIGSTMAARA
jgi:hypothetical protein